MGLYDNIIVNRGFNLPLPEDLGELTIDEIYSLEKQTKSLSNALTTYDLNPDGSITERLREWREGEGIFGGALHETGENRLVCPPQIINFYIYTHSDNLENDYDIEWEYTYTEKEKSIKLLHFKKIPNKDRKEQNLKFKNDLIKRNELLKKWYMQPYNWWVKFVRFAFRNYAKLINKLPNRYKIESWLTPI